MKCPRLKRSSTGLPTLNHVLGGGLVKGSTFLLAGRPAAGKTTLTLQMLNGLGWRGLYATGEETREQVTATARRIGAMSNRIYVLAEKRLGAILESARSVRAQALAIDTIQMLTCEHVDGRPGRPAQLRECMKRLVDYARTTDTTLWLVGHLTNRGDIAGPRTIVHEVDVMLKLDQEGGDERILSCPGKNRFGPTNVVGRLKLTTEGFVEEAA